MNNEIKTPVIIRLPKETDIKKIEKLYAYAVDKSGKIFDMAPFKGVEAILSKTDRNLFSGQTKIYIAQGTPEPLISKANERMLVKAGAYQVIKKFSGNFIDISHLTSKVLKPWHPGDCHIIGDITNTITVNGKEVTGPVCHARVHLVEVEAEFLYPHIPILYNRIPDWLIRELAMNIQEIIKNPNPNPAVANDLAAVKGVSMQSVNINRDFHQPKPIQNLPVLPPQVINGLTSPSLDIARKTLTDYHQLMHPYLCMWPKFWPYCYEWDEDNITYTDSNGHFDFLENTLTEDGPLNIYTWVEVQINNNWETVYRPAMPCHTLWNYPCGTPINIHLNNPHIAPCVTDPLPGDIIWMKKIGYGTSIRHIVRKRNDVEKPSLFDNKVVNGVTVDARGLTNSIGIEGNSYVSPFSGSFPFFVQFGSGFPSSAATHFRWKYRRIADADFTAVTEKFVFQVGSLPKQYTFESTDILGHSVFKTNIVELQDPVSGVYKIPHVQASVDTGIPSAEWDQNTNSLNINTSGMPNGLYEFVFELYDAAGHVKHMPGDVFQIDHSLEHFNEESTPATGIDLSYFVNDAPDLLHPEEERHGFSFLMRIDNDITTGNISPAAVLNQDGSVATTEPLCGFAQYESMSVVTDSTTIPPTTKILPMPKDKLLFIFTAQQAHCFAHYYFDVVKGDQNPTTANIDDQVPERHNTEFTASGTKDYQKEEYLSEMLGTCTKAAFSERLRIFAYHTDGTVRRNDYDFESHAAIAVEPRS